ncbi:MAG: endopeptidase La [Lachnospiraceae bacterium]|nr:endopeptidase La [Lachnospiraceae bacterium]
MARILKKTYPCVPLRGLTVLPGMIVHFDLNRDFSIQAVERAMLKDQRIFLLTQINENVQKPKQNELYETGCVAFIKQIIKLPNGFVRVLIEGQYRARLLELTIGDCYMAVTKAFAMTLEDDNFKLTAMVRELRDSISAYVTYNPQVGKSLEGQFQKMETVEELLDCVAANFPMSVHERQAMLEAEAVKERFAILTAFLTRETKVLEIRKQLQDETQERVEKNQKEYVLREQMKYIQEELGEDEESDIEQFKKACDKLKASAEVKKKIRKEIDRFGRISAHSSESAVARGYIETLLELPWDKTGKDNKDLDHAEQILNEDHYGLEKVKERMLEFLAVEFLAGGRENRISPIICLVGPPGTGKTSIAKSVARALNRKYVRISLGGVRDEAEIRGHRRTYVGAMPGRIAMGLKNAGVKNPLMLLDEIDKMSSDYKGDTASALLEVLDSEQNNRFSDHYVEIPIDLSSVLFIATANSMSDIPRPLLDRMEIIEVTSYTENEKMHIAKEHLIPKQIDRHGLKETQLRIQDKALALVIRSYTREAGVRNLERKIGQICRKAARMILQDKKKSVTVTPKNLKEFLGVERYSFDMANENDDIGIVRGLAWTSVGGDTLQIEVNVMPGKGEIMLTGQLGDVMKESAQAGLSYIRSVSGTGRKGAGAGADIEKLPADYFKKHDFHIHIPQGSVPKDGPSAGITMATALYSAVTGRYVKADVAMTGEITLRGRVLPIGGLKEKILAAKTAGIKTVLVPKKNERDIGEISDEIKQGLKIVYVETMDDVLKEALR